MNMQAIMKQAKKMQDEMMKTQEEIEKEEFVGESSLVTVRVNGKKEILDVSIKSDELTSEDIEILQDMIMVATNQALSKVDQETEKKMSKYANMPGLSGLF